MFTALELCLLPDYGDLTCERYPGSIDYIQQDMQVLHCSLKVT